MRERATPATGIATRSSRSATPGRRVGSTRLVSRVAGRTAALAATLLLATPVIARADGPTIEDVAVRIDAVWILLCAALVFIMHAGFGMLESGLVRQKNTVNVLMKNFINVALGVITFYLVGYGLSGEGNSLFGTSGFMLKGVDVRDPMTLVLFVFGLMFCATAATIVSGAMAERMKWSAYLVYAFFMTALIYPVVAKWVWTGDGWLNKLGFLDFAGSTVVHLVGATAAFAGLLLLGPRMGKYGPGRRINAIPGHDLPLATLGAMILWFGWYGFNVGSTLGAGDPALIGWTALTTTLGGGAGTLAGMTVIWIKARKPDLSMTLNGALGGLVAITATCAFVGFGSAIIVGAVGGALAVGAALLFDRLRLDDPVGAMAVHGVGGAWGTLAVGLFGYTDITSAEPVGVGLFTGGGFHQLGVQALGLIATMVWVFAVSTVVFTVIKRTIGLRVSEQEEYEGLDVGEHGTGAYHGDLLGSGARGSDAFPGRARP
ncbi:MAG: ammonium transporter [Actinobacteria bacterium]|nr:ammonium transporter [Actinomycetota bacterium]